jgi:hypothetical protein
MAAALVGACPPSLRGRRLLTLANDRMLKTNRVEELFDLSDLSCTAGRRERPVAMRMGREVI